MSYPIETKELAVKLRKFGYSIREISHKLRVSKSTASLWLNSVILNKKAKDRLKKRKILGQYKTMLIANSKRLEIQKKISKTVQYQLKTINKTKSLYKLLLSLLFWTEGGKSTDSYVFFTNSDPKMVGLFVYLIRQSFDIHESKFRALIHIHEYHDKKRQIRYWSDITNIPPEQFSKSYVKAHTGKRIRQGYQGSIRIRYYDHKIALELRSFYNTLVKDLGL